MSDQEVIQGVAGEEPRYRAEYEKELKMKHEAVDQHREILLKRRELSSQDLKALIVFAEHFGLDFNIRENLSKFGWVDRRVLMISISEPAF